MILNEFESKKLLEQAGIDIINGVIIRYDGKNIIDNYHISTKKLKSNNIVIKVVSKDIIHKSSVGGVAINVSRDKIYNNITTMIDNIKAKQPTAKIEGFYLQEMSEPGIECIVGIKEDPQFGKVIMFGLGGIYVEIFEDISMRILPITKEDAQEMIAETKVYKILNGARGKHYDIESITDTLIKVSLLSDIHNIKELDINPLVVHEKGVKALDARIIL